MSQTKTKPRAKKKVVESVEHVVTQEDLDNNPELVTEGVAVGDTIMVPPEAPEPEASPKMVAVHNTNRNRAINQVLGGIAYNIAPGQVKDLPEDVAAAVLKAWPSARLALPAEAALPQQPWENNFPDAVERARQVHGDKGFQVKDTVGPDRPELKIDERMGATRDGKQVGDGEGNVFPCPTCVQPFKSLKACREHQRLEHGT
jgi:hypothetical protein